MKKSLSAICIISFLALLVSPVAAQSDNSQYYFIDGYKIIFNEDYSITDVNDIEDNFYIEDSEGFRFECMVLNHPDKRNVSLKEGAIYGTRFLFMGQNSENKNETISIFPMASNGEFEGFEIQYWLGEMSAHLAVINVTASPGNAALLVLRMEQTDLPMKGQKDMMMQMLDKMEIIYMEAAG